MTYSFSITAFTDAILKTHDHSSSAPGNRMTASSLVSFGLKNSSLYIQM